MLQSEYWAPADRLQVAAYDLVPGTDHFVRWSPVAQSIQEVQPSDVLAVGFCMGSGQDELPLSWPKELRRPGGRRRLGHAYVMPCRVQRQLMPLGPLGRWGPLA